MRDLELQVVELGAPPWPTIDPFLFCVHHHDAYPRANEHLGPDAPLAARDLGMDFSGGDGWSMYHGLVVPGFPQHPHRGFETVTYVRTGLVDHADSLGATARYGRGDVQWLTAGGGIQHAEMFPLLDREGPNPLELFQIWVNLPAEDKMVDAHFAMFWDEAVPRLLVADAAGRATEVTVIAGALDGLTPPAPPPASWAARPEADVAIWHLRMEAGAEWALPPTATPETVRALYLFEGDEITVAGTPVATRHAAVLAGSGEVPVAAGDGAVDVLLLQGRPIGEPVAQYGPFVMNTRAEIQQAFEDYQRTGFGGWPWSTDAPVHAPDQGRFAVHADGRVDEPDPDATRV